MQRPQTTILNMSCSPSLLDKEATASSPPSLHTVSTSSTITTMPCTRPHKLAAVREGEDERKGEGRGSRLTEGEPRTLPRSDKDVAVHRLKLDEEEYV